jgi:outer membrane protein
MTRSSTYLIAAACAGAISWGGVALAQAARPAPVRPAAPAPTATAPRAAATAAAPAAAAPLPQGPAIAGLCVYSNEATIGGSAVGKFVNQRLQQLQQQAQAELVADQTSLQTDAKAFDAARTTLSSDAAQQRQLSLEQRDAALQRKAEVRQRELQATMQKAYGRVLSEANPLVAQAYGQHNCSVLLDGQSVMAANTAMNITPEVVRLLDAKITQFPFEREHLDQQAQAAPASAQR